MSEVVSMKRPWDLVRAWKRLRASAASRARQWGARLGAFLLGLWRRASIS